MANFYAGIGSRETPQDICLLMGKTAAWLYEQGWFLRSGAAHGADAAFEAGHDAMRNSMAMYPNRKEIFLPWPGYNQSFSGLHPKLHPFQPHEIASSAKFHPTWDRCSEGAKALHVRNWRILFGLDHTPVKFIVCWTQSGRSIGGTGQALRIAYDKGIPIINFGAAKSSSELEQLAAQIEDLSRRFS